MPALDLPALRQVLRGLKLVTLAPNLPGPAAARELQNLGMEVTKVEGPSGDPLHHAYPRWYARLTKDQSILKLDLKTESGRDELGYLLAKADVLLTSSRPQALARLGLTPQELASRYPRLVFVSLTSGGEKAGHDLTYQAELGLLGWEMPRTLLADLMASRTTVQATLALLFQRERTGKGGYVEISIPEAAALLTDPWNEGATKPDGILGGGDALYGIYEAKGGTRLAIAAIEPEFRARVERELGTKERDALQQKFFEKTAKEWEEWARSLDLPLAEVK